MIAVKLISGMTLQCQGSLGTTCRLVASAAATATTISLGNDRRRQNRTAKLQKVKGQDGYRRPGGTLFTHAIREKGVYPLCTHVCVRARAVLALARWGANEVATIPAGGPGAQYAAELRMLLVYLSESLGRLGQNGELLVAHFSLGGRGPLALP